MREIISIVGRSNTGKTTLLESLIAELKRRGRKVAVIKHSAEDVELDTVNKDTWRFSQAGSDVSAISSKNKLAVFQQLERDSGPEDLARTFALDCDLILTEGFKRSRYPKIEVHRNGDELISPLHELLAIVTDEPLDLAVPQFSRDQARDIADLIESRLAQEGNELDVYINDDYVNLSPVTTDSVVRELLSLGSRICGAFNINNLRISLRRKRDI